MLYISHGQICYINEDLYSLRKDPKSDTLPVIVLGSVFDRNLPLEVLEPLTKQEAEYLLALETPKERLEEFIQSKNLKQAEDLLQGCEVRVEQNGEWLKGVVRYIGRLKEPVIDPIAGVYFGVELQGEDTGKGENDGTYQFKTFFTCQKNCGIFAPFNRINPMHTKPSCFCHATLSGLPETPIEKFSVGDRVVYFIGSEHRHGMVVKLDEEKGTVLISTCKDELNSFTSSWFNNINVLSKDETERKDTSESPEIAMALGINADISKNSMVEVNLGKGPAYGTVRWIGCLPGKPELMAGLELEEDCGVNDGTFKNHRFFTCPPKRGLFVKLTSCQPDARFLGGHFSRFLIQFYTISTTMSDGDFLMKGIQGHCNSCYMDSALFSLFSCSSVLDSLLFKVTKQNEEPIQKTLRRDIVCPLRRYILCGSHCLNINMCLMLFQNVFFFFFWFFFYLFIFFVYLHIKTLLICLHNRYRQTFGGKVESSYFYQIFVDYNNSLVLPTVQQLLEHSFYNSGLRLAEVPSCLILTMPRSGKKFKMFSKIIPSLELDITALLSNGPQQCVVCGQLAHVECTECFGDPVFSSTGFKLFCDTCSAQVHLHPCRQFHKPTTLGLPEGFLSAHIPREKLELFAVLCIETSHYVSFVKHGPKTADWIFFDSMADRMGDQDGYNVPQVKECPEVVRYLTMPLAELAAQVPREMEGVAKRLFCDGYMYMYRSPNMALYR
uniref:ubiquitinyl hydrolase 1 n=1 Tax=Pygocentrus nattereri TaxID=42514 RepID=A0AAR2LN76_PYGNA